MRKGSLPNEIVSLPTTSEKQGRHHCIEHGAQNHTAGRACESTSEPSVLTANARDSSSLNAPHALCSLPYCPDLRSGTPLPGVFSLVLQVMQENPMRTTIVLDDNLIKTAQKYTGLMGKSAPMREALKALIEREAAWRLAELGGTAPVHCRRRTHRPAPRPSPPIPPAWADSRARLHRCAAPVACGSR